MLIKAVFFCRKKSWACIKNCDFGKILISLKWEAINIVESQQEKAKWQPVIKIEEWLFLILLGMIPVINLIAYIYFSFNRKINENKRNFAKAVLIYLMIIIILAGLTTLLL